MKNPEIKALLDELRISKKKAQGLRYALEDSVAEAKAEEEKSMKDDWEYAEDIFVIFLFKMKIG